MEVHQTHGTSVGGHPLGCGQPISDDRYEFNEFNETIELIEIENDRQRVDGDFRATQQRHVQQPVDDRRLQEIQTRAAARRRVAVGARTAANAGGVPRRHRHPTPADVLAVVQFALLRVDLQPVGRAGHGGAVRRLVHLRQDSAGSHLPPRSVPGPRFDFHDRPDALQRLPGRSSVALPAVQSSLFGRERHFGPQRHESGQRQLSLRCAQPPQSRRHRLQGDVAAYDGLVRFRRRRRTHFPSSTALPVE